MYLGDMLVRSGALGPEDLQKALLDLSRQRPRRSLAAYLDEKHLVQPADLETALGELAETMGLLYFPTIHADQIDATLVEKVPVEWARNHLAVPIRLPDGTGMVCTDPEQLEALEELRLMLGEEIEPVISSPAVIRATVEKTFYQRERTTKSFMDSMEEAGSQVIESAISAEPATNDLLRESDQAPVTQLVNMVLLEALKSGASDVHIEPFVSEVKIRFRIDGMLYDKASPSRNLLPGLVSRLKVMARLDIAEKRLPQDGTASVRIGQQEIDIRVSTIPVAEGERVVLRLLHRSDSMLQLRALGLPEDILTSFNRLLELTQGVILITGPTGSGKTTTLYSALQQLDREHLNVMTIEDPVEYQLPGIGQIQVKPLIGLSFSSGLRHILRQDPDIILVGETRDLETAEIMIRASLTGHLVFTTLHTNDAPSALVRLVDMGIEPYLLASSVKAVLAQRLVRKLCPHCRVPAEVSKQHLDELGEMAHLIQGKQTYQPGQGCVSCNGGYNGRIGVYELFVVHEDVQDLIRVSRTTGALRGHAIECGMKTLLEDGLNKVAAGITSLEEVIRICGDHGV